MLWLSYLSDGSMDVDVMMLVLALLCAVGKEAGIDLGSLLGLLIELRRRWTLKMPAYCFVSELSILEQTGLFGAPVVLDGGLIGICRLEKGRIFA